MKVLIVLTSHDELGNSGKKTGFWIEEFAAPYYAFLEAGISVSLASPKGGQPPIDPKSNEPSSQTPSTLRFMADGDLQKMLSHTKKLTEVSADDFDAVFFPGGHGPLWDLTTDKDSIKLIEDFWKSKKPVAAVCHAPSALLNALDEFGNPLVSGKKVTGFTNSEEAGVELTDIVPFLLEDELKNKGGIYTKKEDWKSYVVKDGLLITGQNPASSEEAAQEVIKILKGLNDVQLKL